MRIFYFLIVLMLFGFLNSCQNDVIEPDAVDTTLLTRSRPLENRPAVDFSYIYDLENSTLSEVQREKLFEMSLQLLTKFPCLVNLMKELYYDHRAKIKFEIDSHMNASGCFDIKTKTMSFRDVDCLEEEQIVLEELLHVFQYFFFGSYYMYAEKNAEFEVKVIRDVIGGSVSSFYGITGREEYGYIQGYGIWIGLLRQGYELKPEEFNNLAYMWQGKRDARFSADFQPRLLQMCLLEYKEHKN